MSDTLLQLEEVVKQYGTFTAIDTVSLTFPDDEVCAIIGPNGAGKTTLFNMISGTIPVTDGTITYRGEDVTPLEAHQIANRGLARSFQISNLFMDLSTFENVRLAVQSNYNALNFWEETAEQDAVIERTKALLDRVGLQNERDVVAAELSHGKQRELEIAISLGIDPELLLLDEPSSGMGPEGTNRVINLLEDLAADFPIIVIEHKMQLVREVADRVVVLHNGKVLTDGTPDEAAENEDVKRVYLGTSA
jgi:branched-chain amino acid transport system ATP-binding protein